MMRKLWRRFKLWNLKRKMREAMKHTVFHPPGDSDPVWRAEQQQVLNRIAAKSEMSRTAEIMDEFAEGNKLFDGIRGRLKK